MTRLWQFVQQLTLRRFAIFTILATPAASLTNDSRMSAGHLHVSLLEVSFSTFLLFFCFRTHINLRFARTVLAAALSSRVGSLTVMRFRAFSVSILSAACCSARSMLFEYAISWSRHATSNISIISGQLLFQTCFRKTDIREFAVRKEAHLLHDLTNLSTAFAAILYQRRRTVDIHLLIGKL